MLKTILFGAVGGLTFGIFTAWNSHRQIELHNEKIESTLKKHLSLNILALYNTNECQGRN